MFILITGNHPRHIYFVNSFSKIFKNIIWIIQKRESFKPKIDKTFNTELQKLQKLHFDKRELAENNFFMIKDLKNYSKNFYKIFEINKEDIYNGKLKKLLKNFKENNLITYGCSKLPPDILKLLKGNLKWNVHGGLSPWYRGVTTHFWPSYMLEPEYTGMTLHELTEDIDGGNIIHQTITDLNVDDGIHENACRTVKKFSDKTPNLIKKSINKNKGKIFGIKSNTSGRIWTARMWSPIHLKLVYNVYKDKINKYCLSNKKIKKPKIKSVLL